ncbi:MAG TPA: hypothetical protein VM432_03475 [Bdellovibrionales bacterium]|nr:hypothetical protein [Bdellovibrionales bacterium]
MSSTTRSQIIRLLGAWLAVTVLILTAACSKGSNGDNSKKKPDVKKSKSAPTVPTKTNLKRDPKKSGTGTLTPKADLDDLVPGSTASLDENKVSEEPSVKWPMSPEELDRLNSTRKDPQAGVLSNVRDYRGQDLYYSGSSMDSLREQLMAHLAADPDAKQRRLDKEFASELSFGSFTVDWEMRTARAAFVLDRGGRRIPFDFEGRLANDRVLRDRVGNIELEAVCMDESESCETVIMKVREFEGSVVRNAYILQRQTGAGLFVRGNGFGVAKNGQYDRFLETIWNTEHRPDHPASLKFLKLITTEVMNGPADFTIEMSMGTGPRTEEVIAWVGPLVRPLNGGDMDLALALQPTRASEDLRPVHFKGPLSDTIRETRLNSNDGYGNLTLEVVIRPSPYGGKQDSIFLTVQRMQAPVRTLKLVR